MPSFDLVSEIETSEIRNAVENANRELSNRFDFRGVTASFELKDETVLATAEADMQCRQMVDILRMALAKRGVDANAVDADSTAVHSGKTFSIKVAFKQGIEQPIAKKIVKMIKDKKMKVQAQIQGDKVRVTGKKRDDLQAVMTIIRSGELGQPFQFNNFKD
jgi:uncharacterized protein YajQ (UPF0234 family)